MRTRTWSGLLPLCLTLGILGCGDGADSGSTPNPPSVPLSAEDQAVFQKLQADLTKIINDASQRFAPLRYEYSEGLLDTLDKIEAVTSGKSQGDSPRFLANLDPSEELEHFRESVRRWEAKTGKSLRTEVDRLKAEVSARKSGETFHPEFQREFSRTFDDFISTEVAEMRERRNRAIHAGVAKMVEPERGQHPEAVRRLEELLANDSQYRVPETPAKSSP